jgi:hypothetical protein
MSATDLWLLGSAGVAGLAVAAGLRHLGAGRTGAFAGLLIVGQAAALPLIEAGPRVAYQHLRPLSAMVDTTPIPLLITALWVALVAGFAVTRIRAALTAVRRLGSPGRLALVAAVTVLASATVARNPVAFGAELVLASLLQLTAVANLALAATALPHPVIERLATWLERHVGPAGERGPSSEIPRIGRFEIGLGLAVVVVAAVLNRLSYQGFPHVPDEVAYLFHARYFAQGHLFVAPPPVQQAFDVDLLTYEPSRWYSPVPPGWPAMLAVGVRLGVPGLVNPVLAGLNVVLASLVLRHLYDRRTARLGTVLLAASPWHLFLAMSYMNHTFAFTCALVAALGVLRAGPGLALAWPLIGGMATGVSSLVRPLEGAILGGLLGLWCLARGRGWFRLVPAGAYAVGTIATGALVFPYNQVMTGSWRTFPIMAYTDSHYGPGTNALGFGPNRGLGWPGNDPFPGHGFRDVVVNADLNGTTLNVELLGWATGAVLLLAAATLLLRRRADGLMLAVIVGVVGVHSLYWFSGGPDFGPRYWFLVLLPCVALVASALTTIDAMPAVRSRGTAAALLLSLSAMVTFVPWRATDKYYHYRGMRPDLRTVAREHGFGPKSLILVRGRRQPDYHGAAMLNPVDLRSPAPIYAWAHSDSVDAAVVAAYPDRTVWTVDGPTVTGDTYRVTGGPYPPGTVPPLPEGIRK